MEYRTLGNTGLKVSALSLGGAPLGGHYGTAEQDEAIRAVRTAVDLGINFIDTAPYYGITRSESVLGCALKEIGRDKLYVATKVARYDLDQFDFSAGRVIRSVDESLQRLQTDYVDIIQVHDLEFGSLDQVVEETLPALEKVRQAGKARFIGITGLPLKIFPYVIERAQVDTILSYCHYGLNDTSLEILLPYFQMKGIGIITAAPMGMGLLTQSGPLPWHPAGDHIKAACAKAAEHCRSKGKDIAQLTLQFALREKRIHTVLAGTARAEEVRKNVEWASAPLDEELLREVLDILAPVHNHSWIQGRIENN